MPKDQSHIQPPPPTSVRGNQWTDIAVPELGDWKPDRRVTLVLPHYESQDELIKTVAALTRQTYPLDLMEVIVADDGSTTAPVIPEIAGPLDVSVHVQEDLGFGLARARNLGAQVATGEILIFIDCDMIPERQHVEAHARWHHAVSDAVVFGFRWHAEFSDFSPSQIARAVSTGGLRELVADQDPDRPEWIEGHLDRTDMLTGPFDDLFLVMSGGNLSIRRDMYLEIGGNDESFNQWGGEDNEFAFRALQAGTVVVPERQAVCWHQGEGHEPSPEEIRSHRLQKPKMRNLIAELDFRRPAPGRSYTRPYAVISVDARSDQAGAASATIDSILGSDFHDLIILVGMPESEDDAAFLAREYETDSRVVINLSVDALADDFRWSPVRLEVPVGALFHPGSLDLIIEQMGAAGVGALYMTIPGFEASDSFIRATTTRALNRAGRHTADDTDVDEWIGRLFGERWESGPWLGIGSPTWTPGSGSPNPRLSSTDHASLTDLAATQAELSEVRSRRALRVANAMGSVARARSPRDLTDAVRSFRSPPSS